MTGAANEQGKVSADNKAVTDNKGAENNAQENLAGEGAEKGTADLGGKGKTEGDGTNKNAGEGLYRPDGLPDHLVGTSDHETIDNLFKVVDGVRKANSKKGIPDNPDGYTIAIPDDLKGKIFALDDKGNDPVFDKFRPVFHELGISNEGASRLVTELYKIVSEQNTGSGAGAEGEGTEGLDFEFADFGGAEKARPVADAVIAGLNGLKNRGVLNDDDIAELSLATSYSSGLKAVRKLVEATGEKVIPSSLEGVRQDGLTEAGIQAMMKDERYFKSGKKDPAYIAEVTKKFQQFYGEN